MRTNALVLYHHALAMLWRGAHAHTACTHSKLTYSQEVVLVLRVRAEEVVVE